MHDQKFLAEAQRRKIEISEPIGAEDARKIVEMLHAANPELIKKASAAVNPANP
jgi:hypothetical protein